MTAEQAADPIASLRRTVETAAIELSGQSSAGLTLERPPKAEMGDYSTNAAMLLSPMLGSPPREVAERLREEIAAQLESAAARIEIAGPGFVNVFLSDRWHREATLGLLAGADPLKAAAGEQAERVLVEFVSANPTGPVTVAAGRGAAYGDSLARLFERSGHPVEREYYLNDAGSQIDLFAQSIAARIRGEEPPTDGYAGDYIAELGAELEAGGLSGDDLEALARSGTEAMRARIEATLERFGVHFDTWSSERELYDRGLVEETVAELRGFGHVYESDGAVWLRTSDFGDDKDRVLIRENGEPTYFTADIAYHRDKVHRGADLMITPVGADHHGYVPRMIAGLEALGIERGRYEAPIMQLVNIVDGGERSRMSKRKGDFVTLDALVDDIGVDAARFFMVQRGHDTAFDLDLDLARSASQDNPVYYVQYAHARIAGILRNAAEGGAAVDAAGDDALSAAAEPSERALVRRLLELPGEVTTATERRAPHRICAYASAVAADFHAFYRDCRVVGAEPATQAARLALCQSTARTIATSLALLGVSAPERM